MVNLSLVKKSKMLKSSIERRSNFRVFEFTDKSIEALDSFRLGTGEDSSVDTDLIIGLYVLIRSFKYFRFKSNDKRKTTTKKDWYNGVGA